VLVVSDVDEEDSRTSTLMRTMLLDCVSVAEVCGDPFRERQVRQELHRLDLRFG
jgi:hypothetical protein